MRALGADPMQKLVVPRVYACLVVMPDAHRARRT